MKRFLIILSIFAILAGAALYYFQTNPPVEIVVVTSDEETDYVEEPENEPGDETEIVDTDDDMPVVIVAPGSSGFDLEFRGTKLGIGIGRVSVVFADTGKEYEITANIRPTGIVRQIVSDRMQVWAAGKLDNGKMAVSQFYNASIKNDKKKTRKEKIHVLDGVATYTKYGKERKIDADIFDGAADLLTLIFHIGRTLDETGNCNLSHNGFLDENGFVLTVTDKGKASESGIKRGKKKISEIRCDLVFKNRVGKVMKDYLFEHEFSKKGKKVRSNMISIYYSKMTGNRFVPVLIKLRDTGVGEINVTLTKVKAI